MSKSRKSRSSKRFNLLKGINNTTYKAVPMIKNGLKSVGSTVKNVAIKSVPTVNKGLEEVYGAMATGFNMGIKGVNKGVSKVKNITFKRSSRRRRRRGGCGTCGKYPK